MKEKNSTFLFYFILLGYFITLFAQNIPEYASIMRSIYHKKQADKLTQKLIVLFPPTTAGSPRSKQAKTNPKTNVNNELNDNADNYNTQKSLYLKELISQIRMEDNITTPANLGMNPLKRQNFIMPGRSTLHSPIFDIIVLFDASHGVTNSLYNCQLTFAKTLIKAINAIYKIGLDGTHVGMGVYGNRSVIRLDLYRGDNTKIIYSKFRRHKPIGGKTRRDRGLHLAQRMLDRYGRMDANPIIFTFVNQNSLVTPIPLADNLRLPIQIDRQGFQTRPAVMFAGLLNSKIKDVSEVQAIVNEPAKEYILNLQYCNHPLKKTG